MIDVTKTKQKQWIGAALALLTGLFCGDASAATEPVTLKLLNWADYIAPQVLKDFEATAGVHVDVVAFDSDELKDEKLLATNGGEGLDLVLGQGHSMKRLIDRGWIRPLEQGLLPHRKHLMREFDHPGNGVYDYAVSYLWGTLGIAWRTDKISTPPPSWQAFFHPDAALKGHIMMFDDSREAFAMALIASGHSANATDESALQEARTLLAGQYPAIAQYAYPQLNETSELFGDRIWMATVYNGDALALKAQHPDIGFYIPSEGSMQCVDYIGILKKSPHPREATLFLDYLSRPEVAALNAKTLNYATTNATALEQLPASYRNDPVIYPEHNAGAHMERYGILAPRDQARRAELFLGIRK